MTSFVNTIEAVRQADGDQWRIGDALAKDLARFIKSDDERRGAARRQTESKGARSLPKAIVSPEEYEQCAQQLAVHGYTYKPKTLSDLLRNTLNFPKATRNLEVSWKLHYRAGNPIALKQLLSLFRKANKEPTDNNVAKVMAEWRRRDVEERGEKIKAAKTKRDAASAKIKDAQQRKIGTKDKEERAQADADLRKAKQERIEADQERLKLATAPLGDPRGTPAPEPAVIEVLAVLMTMEPNAKKLLRKTKTNLAELNQFEKRIAKDAAANLIATYAAISEVCLQIVELLGGKPAETKKFVLIEGGKVSGSG